MKTLNRREVISVADVLENDYIVAQIHLVDGEAGRGLLVCKRAVDADLGDTYSIGRDQDDRLIMFYDRGEFIAA